MISVYDKGLGGLRQNLSFRLADSEQTKIDDFVPVGPQSSHQLTLQTGTRYLYVLKCTAVIIMTSMYDFPYHQDVTSNADLNHRDTPSLLKIIHRIVVLENSLTIKYGGAKHIKVNKRKTHLYDEDRGFRRLTIRIILRLHGIFWTQDPCREEHLSERQILITCHQAEGKWVPTGWRCMCYRMGFANSRQGSLYVLCKTHVPANVLARYEYDLSNLELCERMYI